MAEYLRRHGDRGRIDAERRLRRVRTEYERRRRETSRKSPLTVGGSEWVSLGPTNGAGRMTAVAPVPGSPGTVYVGAAVGGVWKTTDGGATWTVLTDALHDLSVGALAVAPSNPQVVYVGTGEGGYVSTFVPGIGLVKSTDGGTTWTLPQTILATQFYRILVHPTDANELVAGTNAGAFRSTDGGNTWTNVISYAEYGDVPDMVRDPSDPKVLYATTWCALRNCTNRSARILRSADGGVTWTDRSAGLPTPNTGRSERTSIAITPSNPRVLYAARAVRDLQGTGLLVCHIYKTTDAGVTWADLPSISGDPSLSSYMGSQAFYDNTLVVSPNDPNVVIAGGVTYVRSADAGASFAYAFNTPGSRVHGDCHDLRYEGSRLWAATDGGISTSDDDARTGVNHNAGLVTRQYYALALDPVHRDRMIAGSQDNGTDQRLEAGTTWRNVSGADGIQCAIHPLSSETAWVSAQGGLIDRTSDAGSDTPHLDDAMPPFDDDELRPFFTLVRLDPREPSTLYTSSTRLWRSRDGGDNWRPLPTITTDGSVWTDSDSIAAVALPANLSPLVIVAKGRGVFRSADSGQTWSAGRGLPDSVVNQVEIDPRDPQTAYACLATTTGPSLFRSGDGGLTWTAAAAGLPPFAAQVLRVDPTDSSDLFCGTDVGVFRSLDRGTTWSRFGTGLPAASVHDVQILDDGSLVRAATYGRGIWELRVTPSGNSAPTSAITAPGGDVSISLGAALDFSGVVADPDAGDTATGTWYFADDATFVPFSGAPVRHAFRRAGVFAVSLAARDGRGARGSATIRVAVREPADACATPFVVPSSGPFPYTFAFNDGGGTTDPTDVDSPCYGSLGREGSTWLEFTPAASGRYTLSTCTGASTVISVYTGGTCGPYTPVPTSCGAIGGESDCGLGTTTVSATLTGGQTYRLMLGGVTATELGQVALTIDQGSPSQTGPRMRRVAASYGPTAGGTDVVITGQRFADGATVAFDGVPATAVAVLGASVIAATTPPHGTGLVDVSVTVPGEAPATLGKGFRYVGEPTPCVAGPTALCLNAGRFRVAVDWAVPAQSQGGAAAAVPLTADTGYFWFFSSNNIELVVKVVDGRSFNGKFWVFYGALSNVEYRITVTDSATGDVRVYSNPNGRLSSVADTAAF